MGEHIKRGRLDLGLLQREAAERIGVDVTTLRNWEWGTHEPATRHLPAIIRFLGYAPFPEPRSLAERLRLYRKLKGISREALARRLGVDPATLWRWESGRAEPGKELRRRIEAVVEPALASGGLIAGPGRAGQLGQLLRH